VNDAIRRTRIVATFGPSCLEAPAMESLVRAGVDAFRMNFAHATHPLAEQVYRTLRQVELKLGCHVAVLADLGGPKLRTGMLEGGRLELKAGDALTLTTRALTGGPGVVSCNHAGLPRDVEPGGRITLDDGRIELVVLSVQGEDVHTRVLQGGTLLDRKGVHLPGARVSAPTLSAKDYDDALFAAKLGCDFIGISFVREAEDLHKLRAFLAGHGLHPPLVAKIEKPQALEQIGAILEATDAVMVARGDLGVEMALEEVPLVQRELVMLARLAHKPVIIATEMLDSMRHSPRATRAEISDVASATFAMADAVMLSGETANGKYPLEAVQTLDRAVRAVERFQSKSQSWGKPLVDAESHATRTAALAHATSLLTGDLDVRAVVVLTRTGATARWVSSMRPRAQVLALTHSAEACRRMAFNWGARAEATPAPESTARGNFARAAVQRLGMAKPGERVLLVWDVGAPGTITAPTVSVLQV
jgi:pyruvate kinase